MSSFSLICQSCASKLKVTNPSLVGQILACPKCGTMIEVTPPAGWQPPAEQLSSSSPSLETSPESEDKPANEPISSSFDDIDSVLNSPQTPAQKKKSTRGSNRPGSLPTPNIRPTAHPKKTANHSAENQSSNSSRGPADSLPAATPTQPILPTDQWTSPETQFRKKRLLQIASLVGVLALSFVALAAIWNHFHTPTPVAKTKAENTETTPPKSTEPEIIAETPPNAFPNLTSTIPEETEPVIVPTPADQFSTPPTLTPEIPLPTNPLAITPDVSVPPTIDTSPPPIVTTPPVGLPRSPIANRNPNAEIPANETASPNSLGSLETLQTQLGELSTLLESSGTSLSKIHDVADINREEQLIGMPKYFIEHPDRESIDIERQLSLPCGGLQYRNAKLVTVLQDLSTITGVPLTLDTDSLLAVGVSANFTVDVNQGVVVDYDSAIKSILQPLGLTKSASKTGTLIVHAIDPDAYVKKTHPLPNFPPSESPDAENLISAIQALFSPESWVQEQSPATIVRTGNEISVNNTVLVHHQIADFIAKVNASIDLLTNIEDVNARRMLTPKWNTIAPKLEQPPGLKVAPDRLLVDLLAQIEQKTGVTVLANWDTLLPLGWTPHTKVPGYLDESNLGEFLKQLTRSMRLTYRAIDDSTVEITSFESAAEMVDLEFYHFGELLTGPLNEEQAMRLISETLGSQLQAPRVRYAYEPKYKSFVLLAPQSIQRQLDALIKKLEEL